MESFEHQSTQLSASPPPAEPPPPPQQQPPSDSGNCTRCHFGDTVMVMMTPQTPRRHGTDVMGRQQQNNYTRPGLSEYNVQERPVDDEDSACPALHEREFHSLHRNVPGLRRAGVDANAIRQHFYPDGGWGWIICGVAFLAHVLTTGFQLSYGLLLFYAIEHLGNDVMLEVGWLGSTSWSVSMLATPIIIALCRRKSTRLTAVIGGLVFSLGILFASFATLFHQVAFSYGIIVGIGASMVRESSSVMVGHYFKRRRQFVEMITMSGEGVGIAIFSVIIKEGVGALGWRFGLQLITGLATISFFWGLLYRPASLYHPQRRAILHLKNQRKKVKEKKTHIRTPKAQFMDFSPITKSSTVRMLIVVSSLASFGIYTPIFFLSKQVRTEKEDLVLLQTFIGLSIVIGIMASGSTINKMCILSDRRIHITRQHVCQVSILLVSISILILSAVNEFQSICIIAWGYGLGLGGYRYTLKMFALERICAKHFTKSWGFIHGAESIPVLIGVPMTAYLNDTSLDYGRIGYYLCALMAITSSIAMSFVGHHSSGTDGRHNQSKYSANGSILSHYTGSTMPTTVQLTSDITPDLLNNRFNCPTKKPYGNDGCLPIMPCTSGTTTRCLTSDCHITYCPHNQPTPHPYGQCCSRHSRTVGPGRLQKSLSFAFQSPSTAMWNDGYHMPYNTGKTSGFPNLCRSGCNLDHLPTDQPTDWYQNPLRSRSVPEDLGKSFSDHDHHYCYNDHNEQNSMTHLPRQVGDDKPIPRSYRSAVNELTTTV